ncbi:MAG: hypothetical protein A2176_11955 [Spirochaetes bacterium RBG_13_51_14]|nr:MAG: hypothetical protein A2176_11955 [Spirochaetes bacterium RBG_13_51_14]
MDKMVMDFVRYYPALIHNTVYIGLIMAGFVALSGCIRFGIAVWRRHKSIYPPATSQMEDH